jgi:hypothetical protein
VLARAASEHEDPHRHVVSGGRNAMNRMGLGRAIGLCTDAARAGLFR